MKLTISESASGKTKYYHLTLDDGYTMNFRSISSAIEWMCKHCTVSLLLEPLDTDIATVPINQLEFELDSVDGIPSKSPSREVVNHLQVF
jgi:hypothetical protein